MYHNVIWFESKSIQSKQKMFRYWSHHNIKTDLHPWNTPRSEHAFHRIFSILRAINHGITTQRLIRTLSVELGVDKVTSRI